MLLNLSLAKCSLIFLSSSAPSAVRTFRVSICWDSFCWNSSAKIFPKNSIILSSRAPVGYLAINDNDMCSNQGIKAIVCNKSIVDYNYLYYLLKENIKNLESKASGSTFKELSTNSLKTFEVELPKLEIQQHVSNILCYWIWVWLSVH